MKVPRRRPSVLLHSRNFSSTPRNLLPADIPGPPHRTFPSYHQTQKNDLLSLRWPSPLQNILLLKKEGSSSAQDAVIEFAEHVASTYPRISFLAEPTLASLLKKRSATQNVFAVETSAPSAGSILQKTDLVATFGGDGTILRASSLFSKTLAVPPILSFAMGTLGFLGEWRFADYKRAFREVYMSGVPSGRLTAPALDAISPASKPFDENETDVGSDSEIWDSVRGQNLGSSRGARVLLRHRLKVGIFPSFSSSSSYWSSSSAATQSRPGSGSPVQHAMNEVLLHRGSDPHLAHISVLVNGRLLTEAVGDGMLVSTPTGSTAYSLSAGGCIVHPLVSSLVITPICPRSLSFRPLVLPANVEVVLRLGEKNRGKEVEFSVDGVRREGGVGVGMEVRVSGEEVAGGIEGWRGGVPCLMRGGVDSGDDGWVGGLNGLLKFNYPFGEEG